MCRQAMNIHAHSSHHSKQPNAQTVERSSISTSKRSEEEAHKRKM